MRRPYPAHISFSLHSSPRYSHFLLVSASNCADTHVRLEAMRISGMGRVLHGEAPTYQDCLNL